MNVRRRRSAACMPKIELATSTPERTAVVMSWRLRDADIRSNHRVIGEVQLDILTKLDSGCDRAFSSQI